MRIKDQSSPVAVLNDPKLLKVVRRGKKNVARELVVAVSLNERKGPF
jgi:hypothetical protein